MSRYARAAAFLLLVTVLMPTGCSHGSSDSKEATSTPSPTSPGLHTTDRERSTAVGMLAYNNPGRYYAVIEGRPGESVTVPPKVIAIIVQSDGETNSADLADLVGAYIEFTGRVVNDDDEGASAPRLAAESYRILEPAAKR